MCLKLNPGWREDNALLVIQGIACSIYNLICLEGLAWKHVQWQASAHAIMKRVCLHAIERILQNQLHILKLTVVVDPRLVSAAVPYIELPKWRTGGQPTSCPEEVHTADWRLCYVCLDTRWSKIAFNFRTAAKFCHCATWIPDGHCMTKSLHVQYVVCGQVHEFADLHSHRTCMYQNWFFLSFSSDTYANIFHRMYV
jgi:hypothetical protein